LASSQSISYLDSGLLLGRPPLLSFFPQSSWNSSAAAGMGFTISTKSSNSPSPRQLSLWPPPSGKKKKQGYSLVAPALIIK
jgi:hypothetical protein